MIERCYAGCDGLVAAPYASALAVTSEEERQFGVTCIDFGAGTTSIALFADGLFAGTEVIPVGAQHLTYDIAKTLQTPLVEAERIKTLYGTLLNAQSDEHELFSYPIAGEEDDASYETTKARLTDIVRPRVQQLLGLVRERLALNAASRYAGDKVVLTGGASQLLGLSEFVANELGRSVRLGRPSDLAGLNASLAGPQLATLSGLAIVAARGQRRIECASRAQGAERKVISAASERGSNAGFNDVLDAKLRSSKRATQRTCRFARLDHLSISGAL